MSRYINGDYNEGCWLSVYLSKNRDPRDRGHARCADLSNPLGRAWAKVLAAKDGEEDAWSNRDYALNRRKDYPSPEEEAALDMAWAHAQALLEDAQRDYKVAEEEWRREVRAKLAAEQGQQ